MVSVIPGAGAIHRPPVVPLPNLPAVLVAAASSHSSRGAHVLPPAAAAVASVCPVVTVVAVVVLKSGWFTAVVIPANQIQDITPTVRFRHYSSCKFCVFLCIYLQGKNRARQSNTQTDTHLR